MAYITCIERLAFERGRREGLEIARREVFGDVVSFVLKYKFGNAGKRLFAELGPVTNGTELRKLARKLKNVKSLEQARKLIRS